jgi:tripartite-type tricarboxylate transporter receptor subunit TctC
MVQHPFAPPRRALLATLAATGFARGAHAQTWPSRPIRMIVAFGAGSGSDIRARLIGDRLAIDFGQPIVIDNRGGANGFLAAEAVARARPDGYTLLFTSNSTHAANPALFRRLPYDPIGDFEPVAMVGETPLIIVVNNDLPVRDLAGFVSYAKANPGRLNYASGNTSSRVGAEMFKLATGIDMTFISYRSNAQGITDVIAGNPQVMFSDASVGIPQVREGRVRAIGITGKQPIRALPGVPTVEAALGLPEFAIHSWSAVFAPAGTPAEIVAKLNSGIRAILALPDIRTRMEEEGTEVPPLDSAGVGRFVVSEIAKWRRVVAQAGIEVAP